VTTLASLAGADADLVTRGMTERVRDNKCLAQLHNDIARIDCPCGLSRQGLLLEQRSPTTR
jgi:hypothetical protein